MGENIIVTGDNGPRQSMSDQEFMEALDAEEARLRAAWIANGFPPEKFFYIVNPPPCPELWPLFPEKRA